VGCGDIALNFNFGFSLALCSFNPLYTTASMQLFGENCQEAFENERLRLWITEQNSRCQCKITGKYIINVILYGYIVKCTSRKLVHKRKKRNSYCFLGGGSVGGTPQSGTPGGRSIRLGSQSSFFAASRRKYSSRISIFFFLF